METFQKKIVVAKNDLIKDVDLPSYKPLNLTKCQINPHLPELCSQGSSFIATSSIVNWCALLKDFDNFKYKVRCKVHFYDTSNKTKLTNDKIKPPIIKSQSNNAAQNLMPWSRNVFIKNRTRYIKRHFTKEI